MNKKQKKVLARIIIAAVLMITLHFIPVKGIIRFLLYMVPYLVIGYDILKKAFKGIKNKQVFDENFLMAVATVGAIAVALYENGDYTEAIAVMLFYQIGELFQRAVRISASSWTSDPTMPISRWTESSPRLILMRLLSAQ